MIETKFTPGPWRLNSIRGTFRGNGYQIDSDALAGVSWVGYEADQHDNCTADAHLIAAAPELYEALDTLRDVVGLTAFKYEGQMKVVQEACDKAGEALAKARGEQS